MNHIRVILVNTSHPGNIGAAARAMKVMGLSKLYLVEPLCDPFDGRAMAMAAHADDVWRQLRQFKTFDEAVAGCHQLFAATARQRTMGPQQQPLAAAADQMVSLADQELALVFGSEKDGLPNALMDRCHYHLRIATGDQYSSLNLAQAVQVIAYELRLAADRANADHGQSTERQRVLATTEQLDGLYLHLEALMKATGFYKSDHPRRMESRIRQIFNRAAV
ncbi:MAG: TrmJ/YjtD family RNA methyltransferase [Gammaproteobacteria bacterium]|nr:TrmJ/YjtD family RNA methyltransferase [Gammaproteobacteria bacterium]